MDFSSLGLIGLFLGNFLAATILPFSSDALYVSFLMLSGDALTCFVVASLGNWLGGVTTYALAWLAPWAWVSRVFRVKQETLEKQKIYVAKYGVWLALISWVPIVGDVFVLALGFFKVRPVWSMVLMLVGKAGRFAVWTWLLTFVN